MEIRSRRNMWTLSLVVCTLTYLLIGAAIFDYLESDEEEKRLEALSAMLQDMVIYYNISNEDLNIVETTALENKPNKSGPQWKFAGSFYFAIVVVTMIGYGYSTPVTIKGRAFCMIYAMFGVPLSLVMFQCLGERLNKFNANIIKKVKRMIGCNKPEASPINLTFAAGLYSFFVIIGGAKVFSENEGWTYLDSIYYCFVTFTTIGFGDLVALQNDHALMNRPTYVAFTLMYILFGLSVVAACFNLLVVNVMTFNTMDAQHEENDNTPPNAASSFIDGDISVSPNMKLIIDQSAVSINSSDDDFDMDQISTCSCSGCVGKCRFSAYQRQCRNSLSGSQLAFE